MYADHNANKMASRRHTSTADTANKHHSISAQIQDRFARRHTFRKTIAVLYVIIMAAYLAWRLTILNDDSMTLSLAYYIAECFGFILGLTAIYCSSAYSHRTPPPAPPNLSVDVLIPTYQEPVELIRRTVMAAKNIDYPHDTWLLDDGKRPEVKALACELGVNYSARDKNLNAKAGNLNHGLQHSKADFVMVFDADHIALPHALDVTLGFFADEQVAMVQTPQDYYNADAFQYISSRRRGTLWHDQSFFYNIAQSCRDAANGASGVGTGVVYRRAALDQIGGVPVTTVTEDIHISLRMAKQGHQIVYLNESIAYGVAASDLREYYKTRHRWAHGNLHVLQHENILFCKGLTFRQRLAYFSLGIIYLEGWQQLLLLLIPIGSLMFGLAPFEISIFNILIVLPFPFLIYLLLQEMGCGFSRYWVNEIFSMARWPVHIVAAAGLFGKHIPWRTSSKNIRGQVDWRLMTPQLSVLGLSVLALMVAGIRLAHEFEIGPLVQMVLYFFGQGSWPQWGISTPLPPGYTIDLVIIAGGWALYNSTRICFFVAKALRDARKSHTFFRFPIPLPALFKTGGHDYARVSRISENWISMIDLSGRANPEKGDQIEVALYLPAGPMEITLSVEQAYTNKTGQQVIEGSLIWETATQRDQLAECLYSADWHREFLNRNDYFLTPLDFIGACLRFKKPATLKNGAWQAVLYRPQNQPDALPVYGVMADETHAAGLASLITFTPLEAGAIYQGIELNEQTAMLIRFEVIQQQTISSLAEKGLDQALVQRYQVRRDLVDQEAIAKIMPPPQPHNLLAQRLDDSTRIIPACRSAGARRDI